MTEPYPGRNITRESSMTAPRLAVVGAQALLDFAQSSYEMLEELAELANEGELTDVQLNRLRAGFKKTWGDDLGVMINDKGRAVRKR
ncbi:hypothetical protein KHQ84_gp106 [Rhodococcus phage Finch]|uniref:Uncharacterized protein n=1 Tax=Rhodococcus phage Finch TaxID=2094144 RepID=A0A2P1JXH6_9CAUD|nr:hypothetical protein KHQ84_gp106 [Rhodococcus phage Finch]AVO25038.1 hypothetical protein SEA_FINCH_106 [Rhodococcus phage Finch]